MTSITNPQTPEMGGSGTVRVDAAAGADVGNDGTVRVATPPAPAAGAQVGVDGTVRVAAPDEGAQGTVRVGSTPAASTSTLLGQNGPRSGDPQRLAVGQAVQLNGRDYTVVSELSAHTSEANTYVVRGAAGDFVLKRYKNGVRMPEPVLRRLKDHGHANVVAVHDLGRVDGQDVELLEYMPGGTLADHLRRQGPIRDLATLRKLVQGLADGLQHLHQTVRMIYQDLKPENVLLADASFSRVVLADFGISTLLKPGSNEVDVTANGTREYAAPELSRFGNQTSVQVSPAVDYFALGITLLECWSASRPFQGVLDSARSSQILGQSVPVPADMDANLAALVKGLIKPLAQDRFGPTQVRQWLDGQDLQVDYGKATRKYPVRWFNDDQSFDTPAQLAALMEADPAKGADFLYLDMVKEWLDQAGDMTLAAAVKKITQEYNRDARYRGAGLTKAIFTLDSDRPFVTVGGRACRTEEELADALLDEKAHYAGALRDALEPFYLYLQANGEGDFADATLALFVSSQNTAEQAFNTTVYTLHEGGQRRLKLEGRYWFSVDEFNAANAQDRDALLRELNSPASRGLIWLRNLGLIDKLAPLDQASPVDLLSIAKALPWIDLKSQLPGMDDAAQARIALELLSKGRIDLLDVYLQQGWSLDVQSKNWSPLAWIAGAGNKDVVQLVLDRGAKVDFTDGTFPSALECAVRYRRADVVELLLARGADANQVASDSETMLSAACRRFKLNGQDMPVDPRIVHLLLQAGADANQAAGKGVLPLHLAMAYAEPADVVDLFDALIAAGASPKARGVNVAVPKNPDCDALFCALYAYKYLRNCDPGFLPVIERLVKAGASVHAVDSGMAPLHFAAAIDDEPLARLLLKLGARRSQVADDHMLAATYAANGKAAALASLLDPGNGLRLRHGLYRLVAGAGRLLALAALLLTLVPLGSITRLAMVNGPMVWGLSWLGSVLLLAGLGLTSAGSVAAFRAGLKRGLKGKGWLYLLVVLPVMVGVAAWALQYFWQRLGGVLPWSLNRVLLEWPAALPVAALAAVVLSMWLTGRAGPMGLALDKLAQARSQKTRLNTPQASGLRLKWILIGLAAIVGGLFIADAQFRGQLSPYMQRNEQQPALLGSTDDPNPGVPVLAAAGELPQSHAVPFGSKTLCTLPAGTRVTAIKPLPRSGNQVQRYQVRVPKPGGDCAQKLLPGLFMRLPVDVVHYPGKPAGRSGAAAGPSVAESGTAKPPAGATTGDSAAPAPKPAAVSAVSGAAGSLSPEGWPVIQGKTLPLFGVAGIAPSQVSRFDAWLNANQRQLECAPREGGTWRCLNTKGADVALGLLLNGAARASDDAPTEYREAMDKAVRERRGQWK